ncbi:MAG: hypothetical protein ACR2JU_03935 [Nocardioidaceae bacterium]
MLSLLKDRAVLVAGTAILGALLVSPDAQASVSRETSLLQAAPVGSSGTATPSSVQVTLITGDVVTVSTMADGRQSAAVAAAHPQGPSGRFHMFTRGGDQYVVPQSAMPYLGSTLDPGLFDVTQLAKQHLADLTVQVQLRNTAARPVVPGVALTPTRGSSTRGTLTSASARVFGSALAQQALRDHGAATHSTGLFSDVTRIAPAASWTAERQVRPSYPMHTLTIKATDSQGRPDNGDAATLYNVDDLSRYSGFVFFQNGKAKVSVPSGHYALVAFFYDYNTGDIYQTTIPQFRVRGDGTVSVDARDATSRVTITTPRPAIANVVEMTVGRSDTLGQTGSYGFIAEGQGTRLFVEPTKGRVSVGQLHYYVYSRLFSPATAKSAYSYDLKFPNDGAIAVNQHYVATADGLAAIDSSYAASHPDQLALDFRFAALPWESFLFASGVELTTPTRRTEYYTARPDLTWSGLYFSVFDYDTFDLLGEIDSSWRSYQPGIAYATRWGGQPTHPRLLETHIYPGTTVCPACISATRLDVLAFPFSDNSPEHHGFPDYRTAGLTESATWSVSSDALVLDHGDGVLDASATPPPGAQVYTVTYDTARKSSDFTRSTQVHTTWQVKADAPVGALPDDWTCNFRGSRHCMVLPLMTSDYNLPVDLLGRIASGTTHATVDIGHLPGAAGVPVASLSAKVSFDGGHRWTNVRVTDQGAGSFRLDFTVPRRSQTDGFGSLSIAARDANGSKLDESIRHAFAVSRP